jgi:hypothetical protein
LPSARSIRKAFGSYDDARRVATAFWDHTIPDINRFLADVAAGQEVEHLLNALDHDDNAAGAGA